MKFYSGLFKIVDIITSCLDWGGGIPVVSFGDGVKRCDYRSDEFRNACSVQPNKAEAEQKDLTLVTAVSSTLSKSSHLSHQCYSLKSLIIEESRGETYLNMIWRSLLRSITIRELRWDVFLSKRYVKA